MRIKQCKIRKALIIDDSIMDCMINEHILHQSNFAEIIDIKYSAATALAYLRDHIANPKNLPDLIFLDLMMPEKDGFDFIKSFGELDGIIHYYCSIIVLSSNLDYIDYQRSLASPFVSNYLKKPLNIEELVQITTR
jgi:response regulator of citrate/malate metabolism